MGPCPYIAQHNILLLLTMFYIFNCQLFNESMHVWATKSRKSTVSKVQRWLWHTLWNAVSVGGHGCEWVLYYLFPGTLSNNCSVLSGSNLQHTNATSSPLSAVVFMSLKLCS